MTARRLALVALFLLAVGIAVSFAFYTGHAWEDWYITFRVSKNLALGQGLVFSPGERVHVFTSPLGTLVPAGFSFFSGGGDDELVLWLFRILSAVLLGLCALVLLSFANRMEFRRAATVFLLGLFLFDAKTIDFSTSGMETAFMVLLLALLVSVLTQKRFDRSSWLQLGVIWAALMWTRPDAFVYFGSVCAGWLLFVPGRLQAESRMRLAVLFLKAGVVCVLLYAPWLFWSKAYYGTVIPHSVIAKSIGSPLVHPAEFMQLLRKMALFPLHALRYPTSVEAVFMPTYYFMGGWPAGSALLVRLVVWSSMIYWCVPGARPEARALSFGALLSHIYLTEIVHSQPWYLPNVTIVTVLVLAFICDRAWRAARQRRVLKTALVCGITGFLLLDLGFLAASAYQLRVRQRVIEDGLRRQIGLFLAESAQERKESVFLEPLGYIGFFSELKMFDFPGLSSPEVVAVRKELGEEHESYARIIETLEPDWLVLRPQEAQGIDEEEPALLRTGYSVAARFDARQAVATYPFLPGREYLQLDALFTVYRRTPAVRGFRG